MSDGVQVHKDGVWQSACPLPWWTGLFMRTAVCDCGERFKGRHVEDRYMAHWYATHGDFA